MGVDDILANLGPSFQILFTLFNTKSGFQGQSVFNLKPATDPTQRDFTLTWYQSILIGLVRLPLTNPNAQALGKLRGRYFCWIEF